MNIALVYKPLNCFGGTGLAISVTKARALDKIDGDRCAWVLVNPDDHIDLQSKISWLFDLTRWPVRLARQIAEKCSWKVYIENFEAVLLNCASRLVTGAWQCL